MPQQPFARDDDEFLGSLVPPEEVVGWDIHNWVRALDFWRRRLRFQDTDHYCLELGCGRNSSLALWLAKEGHRVLCSDRDGVPDSIRAAHARHSVADRVTYASIDARAIPYRSEFDIVAFKSILGGIVGPGDIGIARDVVDGIYRALKPGGQLIFAENLYSTPVHQYARERFGAGKDGWRYFTRGEIAALVAGFAKVEIATCGFLGCFGRTERQRDWLGRFDQSVAERLVPGKWHYIAAVVAEK